MNAQYKRIGCHNRHELRMIQLFIDRMTNTANLRAPCVRVLPVLPLQSWAHAVDAQDLQRTLPELGQVFLRDERRSIVRMELLGVESNGHGGYFWVYFIVVFDVPVKEEGMLGDTLPNWKINALVFSGIVSKI